MTTSIEKYVTQVSLWFADGDSEVQEEFLSTPFSDLSKYHSTLGRLIRNECGLWDVPWEPKRVGGADNSPNHPDAVSMRVIEAVWERLQSESACD